MKIQKVLTFIALAFFASLSYAQPVVIDGAFDPAEWAGASVYPLTVNLPGGGTTTGALHLKNDASNLYVAVIYNRPALDPDTNVILEIDSPGTDGAIGLKDDGILLRTSGGCPLTKQFYDSFRYNLPGCGPGGICSYDDSVFGGTTNGNGAAGNDGTLSVHELWHPLNSGERVDMSFGAGDKMRFTLMIRLFDTTGAMADTFYPGPWFGVLDSYIVN